MEPLLSIQSLKYSSYSYLTTCMMLILISTLNYSPYKISMIGWNTHYKVVGLLCWLLCFFFFFLLNATEFCWLIRCYSANLLWNSQICLMHYTTSIQFFLRMTLLFLKQIEKILMVLLSRSLLVRPDCLTR